MAKNKNLRLAAFSQQLFLLGTISAFQIWLRSRLIGSCMQGGSSHAPGMSHNSFESVLAVEKVFNVTHSSSEKKHIRSISQQTTFSRTRFFSRVRKTEATKMHFRKKLLMLLPWLFWMLSSSGKLPLLLNDLRPRAGRGRGKVWRGRSCWCWCWSTQTRSSPSQSWKVFKIRNEAFIQPQSPAFLSMKL